MHLFEGPGQGHFPTDKESRNRKKKKEVTAGFKLTTPLLAIPFFDHCAVSDAYILIEAKL